ncbi:MAG: hypothetical protein IT376_06560 [Polyangiaceae bacterium]|nr:hypothetical protein [Polyangiaceae bacterium]
MLVLLGPPFEGADSDYARLAGITGMVAYDLRTKLKPDTWGVVRAVGDAGQAELLAARLRDAGFRAVALDPAVGHDPERKIVPLVALELREDALVLVLRGREMSVSWRSVLVLVRGEVQLGVMPQSLRSPSTGSSTFRAIVPSAADLSVFREQQAGGLDAYAALDLHFATVGWVGRIDARTFDFAPLGILAATPAAQLDELAELLAGATGARVDRGGRTSSVLAFTARANAPRSHTPAPGATPSSMRPPGPSSLSERFDAYSRMVAEAERLTRR